MGFCWQCLSRSPAAPALLPALSRCCRPHPSAQTEEQEELPAAEAALPAARRLLVHYGNVAAASSTLLRLLQLDRLYDGNIDVQGHNP